jgi:two-component system, OmpR family, sensor histidine kinase ChvG
MKPFPGETSKEAHRRVRRRALSPITRRILAVNVLALAILVGGLLYLGEYRRGLIAAELAALRTQAEMFAAALGEGAVSADSRAGQQVLKETVRQMVRRLVETTDTRARMFDLEGRLVADSRLLGGPGGEVQIEDLPPPSPADTAGRALNAVFDVYDRLTDWLPGRKDIPAYREAAVQKAEHYAEVTHALAGENAGAVRALGGTGMILSVAVPVQRYKRVLGALMLSKGSHDLDAAVREVRLDILKMFAMALVVTILMSFYLAGTIARPLRRLAAAAERVRRGHHRQHTIPGFSGRRDEIGDLAGALNDMTEALWQRLDAIERFAADVAHEIKNPLTSLRSAVETVARIEDPEQQRKLMSIIQEDVQRLDRLISDISDASRIDAELSREETEPVDLGRMLAILADVHQATDNGDGPRLRFEVTDDHGLIVDGVEGRLVQVFRNLIGNAVSFSPPSGIIMLRATGDGTWIRIEVDDDGPGIPEGKEQAIFERFYSQRPAAEKFGTHSGLGLSISKQIVEAHGGTIEARNRRSADRGVAGTRFTVRLPVG